MKRIGIIGFGRFGKTLYKMISDDFQVIIYDISNYSCKSLKFDKSLKIARNLDEVLKSDILFLAIPISAIEKFVINNRKHLANKIIIDLLSVKTYPKKIFKKYLPGNQVILTHPMFGPDSSKDGFANLPIMMDKFTASTEEYIYWKRYFLSKRLRVIEMTAEEHDNIVAKSQAITHIVGRVLKKFGYKKSSINTNGDKKMLELIEQTCNDDIDLFYNMQNKNPYTKVSRRLLQKSIDAVFRSIIDHRYDKRKTPIYGIQGGKGSFNDEAIHKYFKKNGGAKGDIAYLHTTKKVLSKLDQNEIDFGIFAVSNSRGGIVEETTEELGKHRFNVVEIINLPIQHYIMALPGTKMPEIKRIMAHPQVFKQCEHNLLKRYPDIRLESGKGEAIDSAKAAELLSKNKLEKYTAVMGSKRLADLYGLEILDEHLQDDPNNTTNFLLVKR